MSSGISLGQESGNVLGSYDKSENNFKSGFDERIELSVSVGSPENFRYLQDAGLELGVKLISVKNGKFKVSVLVAQLLSTDVPGFSRKIGSILETD